MSDDMSAVLGASSMIRTMADGTFRIQIDVEPRFAQQAFALFGAPGTPIALARITNEAAVEQDRKDMEPEKPKGGPLAQWAAIRCAEYSFQEFRWDMEGADEVPTEDEAAEIIYTTCGISSRAELDNNAEAKRLFDERIRKPYAEWQRKRGAA